MVLTPSFFICPFYIIFLSPFPNSSVYFFILVLSSLISALQVSPFLKQPFLDLVFPSSYYCPSIFSFTTKQLERISLFPVVLPYFIHLLITFPSASYSHHPTETAVAQSTIGLSITKSVDPFSSY